MVKNFLLSFLFLLTATSCFVSQGSNPEQPASHAIDYQLLFPSLVEKYKPKTELGLIFIDKQHLQLVLYSPEGKLLKQFGVACGKNLGHKQKSGDMRTPEGVFSVQEIKDASSWGHDFNDGKGYIPHCYGPWFIRLRTGFNGIGIHGTHAPESIGTRATEGCIRLNNADLSALKPLVTIGMTVIIGEDLVDL